MLMLKMLCLYFFTRSGFILILTLITIFKQWNLLQYFFEIAKYSFSCILKYYRNNRICWKVWLANSALFVYVATDYVETVKELDFNQCSFLNCLEITHPTAVWEIPDLIPFSEKDFYVGCYVLLLLFFVLTSLSKIIFGHEKMLFLLLW